MCGKLKKILLLSSIVMFGSACALTRVSAVVKDSDIDGLTDQAELEIYHTDPNNPDSDGDGRSDGEEVVHGTNPLLRDTLSFQPEPTGFFQQTGRPWPTTWLYSLLGVITFSLTVLLTTSIVQRKKRSPAPLPSSDNAPVS